MERACIIGAGSSGITAAQVPVVRRGFITVKPNLAALERRLAGKRIRSGSGERK